MNKSDSKIEKFEYKAQMKQLLNIIAHSLYTHPEVFLRELISNSSDALNKVRFRKLTDSKILDSNSDLDIKIEIDPKEQFFSIEDSGIGMNKDELINNIGTVARSGTLEFLNKLKEGQKSFDDNLIGQFGVGFYSVFMVADEVTLETRAADLDSKAYRFTSFEQGTFAIEEIDKPTRGTKIYFKLKDSAKEFSESGKIKETIKKYSNFVDFPVLLSKEKVNTVTALWHKPSADLKQDELDEFYKFLTNDFDQPLGHRHISIEGDVNFKALIFIPKTAPLDLLRIQHEKSLHLYSNKVFIQADCKDLIPEYLRFVKGVVDTEDLPLNISREVTQNSPVMGKIRKILTREVLSLLGEWSGKDKEKYKEFYKNFSPLLKVGLNTDFSNKDKIVDLMRYESSLQKKGEWISLTDYSSRMKQEQKEIYYLSGESRETLENNPNLEYFTKNGIEVLLLTDPVDIFTFPSINEYQGKKIKSADNSDIDLKPEEKIEKAPDSLSKDLISLFKDILKEKVEDVVVSKRLVNSAVTIVAPKDAPDAQMERIMKSMDKNFSSAKKIMEVNTEHPLIRNLSKIFMSDSKSPILKNCILQLYEGSLLMEGNLNSTVDFVKRMSEIMQEATK